VIKSEYSNIKDEDKLQALIRERRRQNDELSNFIPYEKVLKMF